MADPKRKLKVMDNDDNETTIDELVIKYPNLVAIHGTLELKLGCLEEVLIDFDDDTGILIWPNRDAAKNDPDGKLAIAMASMEIMDEVTE